MNREYNKKKISIVLVVFFVLLMLICFSIKGCTKLISSPHKGGDGPVIFSESSIEDGGLISNGISASVHTSPERYSVNELLKVDGTGIDNYRRQEDADLGDGTTESCSEGVFSYAGGNLRDGAVSGSVNIDSETLTVLWKTKTGKSVSLTDCDFVGQPLVVRWDENLKNLMNMSDGKKKKEGLAEVICGATDGKIYFLDADDGTYTREPLDLGVPVSGTGTIISADVPILVIGAGGNSEKTDAEFFCIDLTNCKVIYTFGEQLNYAMDYPEKKYYFNSSPVVSTDGITFITKGENGVIYGNDVNASVTSEGVSSFFSQKLEYTYSVRGDDNNVLIPTDCGTSLAAWEHYIFSIDSKGYFTCVDINTCKMVYIRKLGESGAAAPVLEIDDADDTAFVYVGTSLSIKEGKNTKGRSRIYKLNAVNGEIIWQREYDATVTRKTDGGAVAAACSGKNDLSDYVYFMLAGTDGKNSSMLVCINKNSGEQVYSVDLKNYSVSNPTAVYNEDGKGMLIICDSKGNIFMLDGKTGEVADTVSIGEKITSSPVVFDGMIIIESEDKIYGISIK